MGYVSFAGGVSKDWLDSGRWEIEIACVRYPAQVQLEPWYDPRNERIRS
jgi:4-methylaminobutanoate oxidase (formaldehyde-forming)